MSKRIAGTFLGTGAALTVCLGFRPDWVMVQNIASATLERIDWSKHMTLAAVLEGIKTTGGADADTGKLAYGQGIAPYRGGVRLEADSTSVLVVDPSEDKRAVGTLGPVTAWTLGNTTNRTGSFNKGVNTTHVGVGSRVAIRVGNMEPKWYRIVAITNDGDAANEVTLDEAAPSGEVVALTGKTTHVGAEQGVLTPEGFTINEATDVNVSGELCYFEAGQYQ